MATATDYWFVFDRRGHFQEYEASFRTREAADKWASENLGEFAHVTRDFRRALVRPKV